jgi:hypothetical protein
MKTYIKSIKHATYYLLAERQQKKENKKNATSRQMSKVRINQRGRKENMET